ncbi:DgyrCDS14194 [Dimorphilus gyrociliatus]|uniref:DgyrCDS14194 n=1 Tax=Dimorphilus gyrociliatus TaxID=2664684 RepID=A0A7I8WCX2_9ANNE|nr:DgyrCDS14194 [Dimorphilus gyrociliatus]
MTDGGNTTGECIDPDDEYSENTRAHDYFPTSKTDYNNSSQNHLAPTTFYDEEYVNPAAFSYYPIPKNYANIKIGTQDNSDKASRNNKAYDEVYRILPHDQKRYKICSPKAQKCYDESIEVEKGPPFDYPPDGKKLDDSLYNIMNGPSTNPAQNICFNLGKSLKMSQPSGKDLKSPTNKKEVFGTRTLKGKDKNSRIKVNKQIKEKKTHPSQLEKSYDSNQTDNNSIEAKEKKDNWSLDNVLQFVEGSDQNDTKKKKKKKKSRNRKVSNDSTVKYHDDSSEEQYPSPNVQAKATVMLSENLEKGETGPLPTHSIPSEKSPELEGESKKLVKELTIQINSTNQKAAEAPNELIDSQVNNFSQVQSPTIKEESKLTSYDENLKAITHSEIDTAKQRDAKGSPSQNSLDENWQKFSSKKKREKRHENPLPPAHPDSKPIDRNSSPSKNFEKSQSYQSQASNLKDVHSRKNSTKKVTVVVGIRSDENKRKPNKSYNTSRPMDKNFTGKKLEKGQPVEQLNEKTLNTKLNKQDSLLETNKMLRAEVNISHHKSTTTSSTAEKLSVTREKSDRDLRNPYYLPDGMKNLAWSDVQLNMCFDSRWELPLQNFPELCNVEPIKNPFSYHYYLKYVDDKDPNGIKPDTMKEYYKNHHLRPNGMTEDDLREFDEKKKVTLNPNASVFAPTIKWHNTPQGRNGAPDRIPGLLLEKIREIVNSPRDKSPEDILQRISNMFIESDYPISKSKDHVNTKFESLIDRPERLHPINIPNEEALHHPLEVCGPMFPFEYYPNEEAESFLGAMYAPNNPPMNFRPLQTYPLVFNTPRYRTMNFQ